MARTRVFVLLYLLSGVTGLLYEVVWLRAITLTMGHTAGAVGTVLAAFMGGLAIGASFTGRRAVALTVERALRTYARLELTVAACALLLPFALQAVHPLLAWAYTEGTGSTFFDATRAVFCLLLISIPAAAMGATYPVAVRCLWTNEQGSGIRDQGSGIRQRAAGLLYAFNTIGAAIGATLTGFVLLPGLGLRGTTLVGVVTNILVAVVAFALSRQAGETGVAPALPKIRPPTREAATSPSPASNLATASTVLAVSGFVALVYEVTWTRVLATILGPTTYAFSAMLVAFIGGLAIGSAAAATLAPRTRRPGLWLGVAMILAATAALGAGLRVDSVPLILAAAAGRADVSFTSMFALDTGIAIAMQLPMTIALGATFPLAIAFAAPTSARTAQAAAMVYAANTAGAIAGALSSSFVLVPWLGLQTSMRLASLTAIATGLVVAWQCSPGRAARGVVTLAAIAATAMAVLAPGWNQERVANGAYRFAPALAAGDIETGLETGRLSYYREGSAGTVSVRELLGISSLAIDGKVDASNGADMLTQKLLAHLPLILHDNPRRVYVIGLGSGVTLGAALSHPIERATVSEISPEVVAASEAFSKSNHNALRDPRTQLIVGDGRSHLLLSSEQYDVIISEPSNPWMAGVSALFTQEFFTAARRRLAPGGILCQWAHTYNIGDGDLRSIVATFLSTFPDGSAWLVGEGDLLLIGTTAPIRAFDAGVGQAWTRPGVAADLAEAGVRDPFSLLTLFVARGPDLARYAASAPVQTDDALALEFSAPRATYGQFERGNVKRLRTVAAQAAQPPAMLAVRSAATAAEWRHRAQMELAADAPDLAYADFVQALAQDPDDLESLDGFARASATTGRLADAEAYLRRRTAAGGSAPAFVELSVVLAAKGQFVDAAVAAQRAAALNPSFPRALEQLISTLADGGNDAALEQLCGLVTRPGPPNALATRCQMRLSYLRGDFADAAGSATRLTPQISDATDAARVLNLAGSAYAALGDHDKARAAFEASLVHAPRDAATLVNLGLTELQAGRSQAAVERFSDALFVYPTLAPALDGLAQALDQQGRSARAAAIRSHISTR